MSKIACFYARQDTHQALHYIDFYTQDMRALRELGFEIRTAIRPWEMRVADLYYVWWWTHACFPTAFAGLLDKPVIITGTFNEHLYGNRPKWQRSLISYSFRRARFNICVSLMEYEKLRRRFPQDSWIYSPHCIDSQVFKPADAEREEYICTVSEMTVGNAERKCIPEIIRAIPLIARQCPGIRFILAGRIDPVFLRLAGETGAARYAQFPGIVSSEEKIRLLQRCRLFLQPSRFEGFGLSILEAMACGAPVVTSPAGAVPEVVGDCAQFVDGTSPEGIARGVVRLLSDSQERSRLSREGRERAVRLFDYSRRKADITRCVEIALS
jgi:glycosyltransferase involved in cell wall biosynthesis